MVGTVLADIGADIMRRSYIELTRSWHARTTLQYCDFSEELMIQIGNNGSGVFSEFAIRMYDTIGLRLEIYDDAFKALPYVQDLLNDLSDLQPQTIDDVKEILKQLEFADDTITANPQC